VISGKYARLAIGILVNEKAKIIMAKPGDLSMVPYAEPSAFQGFYSPYYNDSHRAFRKAVRTFMEAEIMEEAAAFDEPGKTASKEVYLKMGAFGLLTSRMGPGSHLKGFNLPAGVKSEEFDCMNEN
jgi:hypothetical protein